MIIPTFIPLVTGRLSEYYRGSLNKMWSDPNRPGSKVQSVLIRKDGLSKKEAKNWLKQHGYKCKKIDETETFYRFRQLDPKGFRKGTFRTQKFNDNVQVIVGVPKK